MRKFGDFFKRIKLSEKDITSTENKNVQDVQIQIEGNMDLFKDEKENDAIITIATMFRGLKFKETKRCEDGTLIVVLRETAQQNVVIFNEDDGRDL